MEEKEMQWKSKWELPRDIESRSEYVEKIAENMKINQKKSEIVLGIEKIKTKREEDRKHW